MGQSLDKVLQPDGSYKWEMVELTEARTKGLDAKPEKAEKPVSAPKATKKAKTTKVSEPTESAPEA
jgi:hypothetical protein